MFFYKLYSLSLCSNICIPWFQEEPSPQKVDYFVRFDPHATDDYLRDNDNLDVLFYSSQDFDPITNQPCLEIYASPLADTFYFRYCDGVKVLIDQKASKILFQWPIRETLEFELGYFVAPVMSFVLFLRGLFALHASAVVIQGHAVLFLGNSGSGKSSLALAFASLGYPIISDDLSVPLLRNDQFWVTPAFPLVRVWEPTVEAVFGTGQALPRIVPKHTTWNKRYLDLRQGDYKFQGSELPLGLVYVLCNRSNEKFKISLMSKSEAFSSLLANVYSSFFCNKLARAKEFIFLSQILRTTPIRSINPSTNISDLLDMCYHIINDVDFFL